MDSRLLLLLSVFLCISLIYGQPLDALDSGDVSPMDSEAWQQRQPQIRIVSMRPQLDDMDKMEEDRHQDIDKDAMDDNLLEEEEKHLMEILGWDLSKLRQIKLRLNHFPRHRFPIEKDDEILHGKPLLLQMKLMRLKLKLKLLKMLEALCAAEMGAGIVYRGKVIHPRSLERHFLQSVLAHKILIKLLMSMKMRTDHASPLALKLNEMKTKVGKALLLYAPNRQNTRVLLHADRAVVNVGTTLARSKANTEDNRMTLNTAAVQRPTLGDTIHDLRERATTPIGKCLHHLDGRLLCPRPGRRWRLHPLPSITPHTQDTDDVQRILPVDELPRVMEAMRMQAPVLRQMVENENYLDQDEQ